MDSKRTLRWHRNNPEIDRQWRKDHPTYAHDHHLLRKTAAVKKLGGKCCRCGFDDIRALCFDHVNGGGNELRRNGQRLNVILTEILKYNLEYVSKKYQILCANCNLIKQFEKLEFAKCQQKPQVVST